MYDFANLHVHGPHSLMDGYSTEKELVAAAVAHGQKAIALTDHGTPAGHRNMQQECKAAGIKPILGLEAYLSPTDRFDRRTVAKRDDNTNIYNHLIILAKDNNGLRNLQKLSEIAWREGYYHKPRIDREILTQYSGGLVVLSGCLSGVLAKAIERDDPGSAEKWMDYFQTTFGEDFYVEIQSDNPSEINTGLIDLADKHGARIVATADCHFATEKERDIEEIMLILSTGPKAAVGEEYAVNKQEKDIFKRLDRIYPDRPISFAKWDLYIRNREQMEDGFQRNNNTWREDFAQAAVDIADGVGEYDYHENLNLLPKPRGEDPHAILSKRAWEGLRKHGKDKDPKYREALEFELGIIKEKDFSSYFLIKANAIRWAREQDIRIGPGRGSAAGSVLVWCLNITQLDPIKNGLLFFRFMNPERGDYPDIDTDVEDRRRGEIIEYKRKRYKYVANIATYNTYKDKNVLKDVARVFRVPMGDVNKAMKQVHSFEDYENSPNVRWFRDQYPEVLHYARMLRGRIRGTGMHAAGVIVSKEPIENYAPIETRTDPDDKVSGRIPAVAYDKNVVEQIGLIKFDWLGLKNLTVIGDTLRMIKERHGLDIELPVDVDECNDANVYKMLSNGFTQGVFQCEQPAYTQLLKEMKVESFADLAVSNALVRPGAKNTVGSGYIARKEGRELVKYAHESMKPFTEETYGVVIYQEQVMLTMTELAGMSMGTADKVRKLIGKKKDKSEFEPYRIEFVEGASKKVHPAVADALWNDFTAHADYSFNKSHAYAYSLISYWTAWLKYNYPLEFMCALLMNEGDKDKRTDYLIETKRLGLKVLLPHVNKSDLNFKIEGDAIRFGLIGVKFISDTVGKNLLDVRPFANYAALQAAAEEKGTGINSRMIGALDKIGGAYFDDNPKRGDESNYFYEYLSIPKFASKPFPQHVNDLVRPLDEYDEKDTFVVKVMVKKIKKGTGWARVEVVDETGTQGIFHNENTQIEPGQQYYILVSNNRIVRYVTMEDMWNAIEKPVSDGFVNYMLEENLWCTPGYYYVVAFDSRKTKAGKMMGTLVLSNDAKEMRSVLVFSTKFGLAYGKAKEGTVQKFEIGRLKDGGLVLENIE